jgi:hypothetical protein
MIARDIYPLAMTLQAHLPDPWIRDTVGDPLMQNAVADRCVATCQQAGMADGDAQVIGEALAGYLYGWCSRDAHLDERISHAQTALNCGAGGSGDHVMLQRPTETALPVGAIALMVAGVLGLEVEAR